VIYIRDAHFYAYCIGRLYLYRNCRSAGPGLV